ncbi:MAG: HDOD domain-containing protein [Myxococcota bacterium]
MSLFKRSSKLGKSKGEEGYGRGEASIAEGDDVLIDEDVMVEKLMQSLEAPDYQPPTLPSVAVELMGLARKSDVDMKEVVGLLEQDSMIAGRVLKLVQSPLYSGLSQINSLNDALMRVGLKTLRDVVMQIAMNMKVFRSTDYADTMELLRRHSTMTAHMAKIVCKHARIDADGAFLAGLLHDVGIAGTLLALSEGKGNRKTPPDLIAIWPAVDRVHTRAAEIMAGHWDLSEEIVTALAAHHQVLLQGKPHPLAACVAIADDLAHERGFGVVPKSDGSLDETKLSRTDFMSSHVNVDRSGARTLEHARNALDLDDAAMEQIRAQAAELENPFA